MKLIKNIAFIFLFSSCYYNSDDLSEATKPANPNALTYNKDVKRIFDSKCINCHSATATQFIQTPFYTSFSKIKNEIVGIESRTINLMDMPRADSFNGPLTQGQKDTLQLWINQGALE